MKNFRQIAAVFSFHQRVSEKKKQDDDFYTLDRSDASAYFNQHPSWGEKIGKYHYSLREHGEKIIHLDICGRASWPGADKSYCFSIKASNMRKIVADGNEVFFDGDLWNERDFSNFLSLIKCDGVSPALVTFEPVAGLQGYGAEMKVENVPVNVYREITYWRLAKRLCQVIEILRPGGYVYIERPFQNDAQMFGDWYMKRPVEEWWISVNLQKVISKLNCTMEIHNIPYGTYFLVRKSKARGKVKK